MQKLRQLTVVSPVSLELFTTCQYPTTPDTICGREIPPKDDHRPGPPRKYCDDPDHTALRALRARQKFQRRAELEAAHAVPDHRPVSTGLETLSGLISRAEALREEWVATFTDMGELLAVVCEPGAVDHELSTTRRDAEIRIAEAESRQANADRRALKAEQLCAEAVELQRLAVDAAEEAVAKSDEAAYRTERTTKQATERIAAAVADRDRIRAEADASIEAVLVELDEAKAARVRAETERDAARADATAARGELAELRIALDTEQRTHHARMEDLHATHALALAEAHKLADAAAREMRQQNSKALTAVREDYKTQLDLTRADLAECRKQLDGALDALDAQDAAPTPKENR